MAELARDVRKSKFDAVQLPYAFTEAALAPRSHRFELISSSDGRKSLKFQVSNTFDAHRVLTAAYQKGGPEAQDKAAEALFHSYFAKEPPGPVCLGRFRCRFR